MAKVVISISMSAEQSDALRTEAAEAGMDVTKFIISRMPDSVRNAPKLADKTGVWYRAREGDTVTLKPGISWGYEADSAPDIQALSGKVLKVVKVTKFGVVVTDGTITETVRKGDVQKADNPFSAGDKVTFNGWRYIVIKTSGDICTVVENIVSCEVSYEVCWNQLKKED